MYCALSTLNTTTRCPWARHRTPNCSLGTAAWMAAHCSGCVFTAVCVTFLKEASCLLRLHLFDQKHNNILTYIFCFNILKCYFFLWCKAEFSASLLQCLQKLFKYAKLNALKIPFFLLSVFRSYFCGNHDKKKSGFFDEKKVQSSSVLSSSVFYSHIIKLLYLNQNLYYSINSICRNFYNVYCAAASKISQWHKINTSTGNIDISLF